MGDGDWGRRGCAYFWLRFHALPGESEDFHFARGEGDAFVCHDGEVDVMFVCICVLCCVCWWCTGALLVGGQVLCVGCGV